MSQPTRCFGVVDVLPVCAANITIVRTEKSWLKRARNVVHTGGSNERFDAPDSGRRRGVIERAGAGTGAVQWQCSAATPGGRHFCFYWEKENYSLAGRSEGGNGGSGLRQLVGEDAAIHIRFAATFLHTIAAEQDEK